MPDKKIVPLPIVMMFEDKAKPTHTFSPNADGTLILKVREDFSNGTMSVSEVIELRNLLNQMHPIQSKKRSRPTRSTRASTKRRRNSR